MSEYDDDAPPAPRLPLTPRPPRLGMRVSGARIGDLARPAPDGATLVPAPARRLGLRTNTTTLRSLMPATAISVGVPAAPLAILEAALPDEVA
jgi:hypothetical protein